MFQGRSIYGIDPGQCSRIESTGGRLQNELDSVRSNYIEKERKETVQIGPKKRSKRKSRKESEEESTSEVERKKEKKNKRQKESRRAQINELRPHVQEPNFPLDWEPHDESATSSSIHSMKYTVKQR